MLGTSVTQIALSLLSRIPRLRVVTRGTTNDWCQNFHVQYEVGSVLEWGTWQHVISGSKNFAADNDWVLGTDSEPMIGINDVLEAARCHKMIRGFKLSDLKEISSYLPMDAPLCEKTKIPLWCMSTRSSSSNLFPSSSDPESIIRNRRRNLGDPSLLLDFEEINMNHNNNLEPPPAGPIPQNGPPGPIPQNHGPPRPNLQNPIPVSSSSGSSSQNDAITALTKHVEALISSMNKQIHSIQEGCETCGGPHSYFECQAAVATLGTYMLLRETTMQVGEVEKEPETLMDEVHITSTISTAHVPPPGIQPVSPPKPKEDPKPNPYQPKIPYPSRLNKSKLLDKNDV
ncbi:hypothetical protein Tco_0152069 [Tanacetum coccineum]